MNQKYEILADALRQIVRYEHCNCGCHAARSANPLGRMHSFQIAKNALEDVGEFIPVMANNFVDNPDLPPLNSSWNKLKPHGNYNE